MARHFVVGVLVAFLPAAIIGAALHGFIKDVLFNPWIVCATLIVGGFVLLAIDRMPLEGDERRRDALSAPRCIFKIGSSNAWRWSLASPVRAPPSWAPC